jgi:DNA repair protein RecN (Recombination protein N)
LLRGEAQRQVLDSHARLTARAQEVALAYREWQRLARARLDHQTHAAARTAEREQLAWQAEELSKLALGSGEWDAVQNEQRRLAHAASLIEGVQSGLGDLSEAEGAALGRVSGAISRLRPLTVHDSSLGDKVALLDSAQAQLLDAVRELRHYADRIELDPERLRVVEERLQAIHGASRRFRVAPEALPELHAEIQARLRELEIESDPNTLEREERTAAAHYRDLAQKLSAERKKAAAKLAREVTAAMKELAMSGARFEVALHARPEGSAEGNEEIEFLVTANAGFEPRPLAKVASGGELSRISLAIQVITSKAAAVPTLIFDEVDAGIGGAVAEVVGTRLRRLGEDRQVLCVTHLPQVAARAMQQWSVAKTTTDGSAKSRVDVLDEKGRIEEIARMLGGVEITATTRRHAAEMIGTQ